ncbi:hypothetical protein RSOLAG1IB_00604 [Rhizoctonia solani AG-1 IB]|uniref:Uncharacterized protein n=1 Tax=Thanatephorus cucumeris (strain AG1-IB / isolate 7/3/14) TaxID=1108050 RepID=A0A0B7F793_THACB|nr:hypothetical protein RSOLAG1IB_00604 [Rhizoctonia solani AG-1 IB]
MHDIHVVGATFISSESINYKVRKGHRFSRCSVIKRVLYDILVSSMNIVEITRNTPGFGKWYLFQYTIYQVS